ncbi:FkbM family methyltransferase [Cyanobacterium aponinum FACHB-4101]|uniref:FkbM family methyltransferase n=1 Tax=Cyanobacterium aponinum TaxID=379064 RepID=UPI001681A5BC|nr:FkbM family methyltransferase [Cyanobacterium aponinum]MBD2392882.1 FkbM family methyltransferase [Cyanobacterium aponinum FACHB-4101]
MENKFISYAQNFEDVLLNRIFREQNTGFYVDIGANHPVYDSVTKAFYERGWRGINIEPVPQYYNLLKCDRTEDINLNIGISDEEGELTFCDLVDTGLSTFDQEMAEKLSKEDGFSMEKYTVKVKKLADICHQYIHQPIDFLKVDVEGWEEKVIYSGNWQNFRPKVIIIEATIPNSPQRKNTNISNFLHQYNYHHIYFDGLNDFYIAEEFKHWENLFRTPVNVFDQFITYPELEKQKSIAQLQIAINSKDEYINNLKMKKQPSSEQINNLEKMIKTKDEYISSLEKAIKSKEEDNQNATNELIKCKQLIQEQEKIIKRKYTIHEAEKKDLNYYIQHLQSILSQQQETLKKYNQEHSDIKKNQSLEISNLHKLINDKNAEIEGMKSSKFWKLRKKWFKIKKLINEDAQ